jgi:hypothetical protein
MSAGTGGTPYLVALVHGCRLSREWCDRRDEAARTEPAQGAVGFLRLMLALLTAALDQMITED